VIKVLHGYDGKISQKVKSCYPSLWLDIIHEVEMFKSRGSGEFTIMSVRKLINDFMLPEVSSKTRWIKGVPIKVNVHAWKVKLDGLPTRLNISRRGIDIEFILCPMCGKAISRWWDIDYMEISSYKEWWYQSQVRRFDQQKNNIQAQQKKKMMKKSSSSENEPCCSKDCKKNTGTLNKKITYLEDKLFDANNMIFYYKLGYSAVSPPIAQIYSSPKKDLSWTGLFEFADDTITDYSRPLPAIECTSDDAQNKNPSVTETGALDSTILSKPPIKFVKAVDSAAERSTTNKVEAVKKSSVRYAELYRKPLKKPNGNSGTKLKDSVRTKRSRGTRNLKIQKLNIKFEEDCWDLRAFNSRNLIADASTSLGEDCWELNVQVPTSSEEVLTASPVFAIATVVTPVTRRKGKEVMVESETLKKQKVQEQIDAQVARELEEQLAREDQKKAEQIARDADIERIHAEEELQIMISGLDRNNETIAKYLDKYQQFLSELPIERRIELISDLVKDFRGMAFEEVKAKFNSVWKQLEDFIPMGSKEEAERIKRKCINLEQGSAKKQKILEEVTEEAKPPEEVPKEKVKEMMQLVPIEEVYVESLQVKHPIIDWKVHSEGQRSYWKITRLVKETLSNKPPTSDKEMELWVELNMIYEPDKEDQLWTHTHDFMHAPVDWKLYDSCGVHHVTSKDKEIFMLMEKDYPLRKGLTLVMICYKLQVENFSQMANDLILKIYKIANYPRQQGD
nr:RNA-directed DNA polymerase, eukaryota [Tanacetum cinerariifolium]